MKFKKFYLSQHYLKWRIVTKIFPLIILTTFHTDGGDFWRLLLLYPKKSDRKGQKKLWRRHRWGLSTCCPLGCLVASFIGSKLLSVECFYESNSHSSCHCLRLQIDEYLSISLGTGLLTCLECVWVHRTSSSLLFHQPFQFPQVPLLFGKVLTSIPKCT